MATGTIDESQRKAAKVAGVLYLAMMATSIFFQVYVRSGFIVPGDAAKTASNIMASERLFRIGIVFELITCAGDIVLVIALYTLLKPVNQSLALLAAFWRLAESTIFGVVALSSMVTLLFLSGANHLRAFTPEQLQSLARVAISAHVAGFNIGLAFLALGGSVFSYLLFKSRYVPNAFGVLGMFAYALMLAGSLAIIIFPNVASVIVPGGWAPAFVFEVGCGLWFLVKGVRASESTPRTAAAGF
jgi:hypothetical protein